MTLTITGACVNHNDTGRTIHSSHSPHLAYIITNMRIIIICSRDAERSNKGVVSVL